MAFHLAKTIALVGLMGAGKTAVGSLVAEKLGVPFLDSDQEIIKAAAMPVAEIFERDGEAFFRSKETQILERLLRGGPCILSTGGGAFMQAANRKLIRDKGVSLWLRADLDLLWSRVKNKDTRPLLLTENPYQTLSDIHDQRSPVYAKAQIVVDAQPDLSLEQMANRVISTLVATSNSGVQERPAP